LGATGRPTAQDYITFRTDPVVKEEVPMAVTAKVLPGEVLKIYPWARVEPNVRHGGVPAGPPLASVTADLNGLATYAGTVRIEYAALRADGRYLKLMDSITRGGAP
jgi:hypothetical protein